MSSSSASILLLPLLLLLSLSTSSSSAPSNPLCNHAPYPLLCARLPPTQSPRALAELAARAAAAKVSAAVPFVNKLRSRFARNARLASTLDVCAEVYASAADALNSAANALRRSDNMNEIMTDLSASLTDVGTCDDAFDEDPSLFNPVVRISRNLNRMVTNSLTLASVAKRSS